MYAYEWDITTGGYNLTPTIKPFDKDVRPVFFEELEFLRLDKNFFWLEISEIKGTTLLG